MHACCLQSPPKGEHRYVFILYPQHGRVNAKAPKARQNFTLHQFEKVSCTPAGVSESSSVAVCTGTLWFGETHKEMQSSLTTLCIDCRSTISEILLM